MTFLEYWWLVIPAAIAAYVFAVVKNRSTKPKQDDPKKDQKNYQVRGWGAFLRLCFALGCWVGTYLCLEVLFSFLIGPTYGRLVALALWVEAFAQTLHLFVVFVPGATGLILTNTLVSTSTPTGNQSACGPGPSIKYPYEDYVAPTGEGANSSFISLRLVTQGFEGEAPSKDGPPMRYAGLINYRPLVRLLPAHVAVSDVTIKSTLQARADGFMTDRLMHKNADDNKGHAEEHTKALQKHFEDTLCQREPGSEKESIQETLGVDVEGTPVSDVDYTPSYQATLDAMATSVAAEAAIRKLTDAGLDARTAATHVQMMVRPDSVQKTVIDIEGLDKAVVEGLMELARAIAPGMKFGRSGAKKGK